MTKILTALTILDASVEGVVGLDDEVGPPGVDPGPSTGPRLGAGAIDSDQVLGRVGTRRVYSNRGIELAADHLASAGPAGRSSSNSTSGCWDCWR